MNTSLQRSRGAVSIAQLLVAAGLASGITLIVAKLSQQSGDTARKAMDGFQTTAMRDGVSNISKDPGRWVPYQLRADALNDSSVLSNCLRREAPYTCPADDTGVDAAIRMEAGGRPVSSMNLYAPLRWTGLTTMTAGDFQRIAGTEANPAYFDRDGAACAGGANDAKCLRRSTGYFVRQNLSGDPGSVLFIVRLDQNPQTLAKQPNAFRTSYMRINVGKMWRGGGAGPVPVGSILPFSGAEAQIPPGYLPCNGARYNWVTDYPQLYAVIGTRWTPPGAAAPGADEFYVPDLRGQYLRGLDTSTGGTAVDPDRASRTVGSFQVQQVDAAHGHAAGSGTVNVPGAGNQSRVYVPVAPSVSVYLDAGAFAQPFFPSGASIFGGGGGGQSAGVGGGVSGVVGLVQPSPGIVATQAAGHINHALTTTSSVTTTNIVSSAAVGVETRPPSAWVQYIIRADY